ncbi:FecR family protein, partial [Sphingomonas sp.]|uniref:FecR family protein n=1 Tax=Sphingomonas sp. TaxID=28214 RepID=UPI00259002B8
MNEGAPKGQAFAKGYARLETALTRLLNPKISHRPQIGSNCGRFPRRKGFLMVKRALAILATGCSTMAMAQERGWTISEASGPVQIAHAGLTKVATRGNAVVAGDTVTTGSGARAVLVRGSEFMMVAPASQLRLPAEAQPTGFTRVVQDFGNVVFMIKKKLTPHFEVKTPYLAAVVKGTTFSIGVTPQGSSVQVLEGAVDVATGDGGAHDMLRPGAVAVVGASNIYRLQIEAGGVRRTIESPSRPATGSTAGPTLVAPAATNAAAPEAGGAQPAGSAPAATATPAIATTPAVLPPTSPVSAGVITAAIYEAPVSLASTTGGLVSGSIGGGAEIAAVASATKIASEGTISAAKAVHVLQTTAVAAAEEQKASAAAAKQAETAAAATDAQAAAERARQDAADAAQRANDAAAQAAADQAKSDAAKAAA